MAQEVGYDVIIWIASVFQHWRQKEWLLEEYTAASQPQYEWLTCKAVKIGIDTVEVHVDLTHKDYEVEAIGRTLYKENKAV